MCLLILGLYSKQKLKCTPIIKICKWCPWIVRSEYSSSLNIFNQKYFRTNSYSSLSYYFEAIQLNVSMNGNYTIISISNIDTFGYIYKNAFNPTFPFLNLIASNDDTGGNRQFKLKLYLNIEIEYILIVTTYDVNITGSYSILTTGPASIRFSSSFFSKWND